MIEMTPIMWAIAAASFVAGGVWGAYLTVWLHDMQRLKDQARR